MSDAARIAAEPYAPGWPSRSLSALGRGGARGIAIQLAVVLCVAFVLALIAGNVVANLQRLGIRTGFAFLARPAGFDISQSLISLDDSATYLTVFVVALLNTLLVTALAIVLATMLGFLLTLARRSSNGLIAWAAQAYVETFRNIPLLLQFLFWYFAILRPLPGPRSSLSAFDIVFLNGRGLFLPWLRLGEGAGTVMAAAFAGLALSAAILIAARRHRIRTGHAPGYRWLALVVIVLLPLASGWLTGAEVAVSVPRLQGFNFVGGITLLPELFALSLGLTIYSAAFIAEIMRGGIQAVPRGQIDAAISLGLTRWQVTRLVVIPLAMRTILPPLSAYYIILLKNSSLGSAIAYPDLMHVFAGTVLNQTSQPLEVMLMTLSTYLVLGLAMSTVSGAINRRLRLR